MSNEKERDYSLLMKPYWYPSDIEKYYGVSKDYALKIRAKVERKYGCPSVFDKDDQKRAVRADDVIVLMGGKSRLDEAQIFNALNNFKLEGDTK